MANQRHLKRAVLVSAADHGIGRETALWLGERGHHVLAVGNDLRAMDDMPRETAPGGLVEIMALKSNDAAAYEQAVARAVTLFGRLDAIICAGGAARRGPVEEVSDGTALELLTDNYLAPLRLIRPAARLFRQQHHGRIVCLSAGTGRIAMPMSGPYCASRFALEGLCDALRLELRGFGVDVSLIEPGLVRDRVAIDGGTNEPVAALFEVPDDSPYATMARALTTAYNELLLKAARPLDVARVIERAITVKRPKPRYAVTRGMAALLLARKLLPDRMLDRRLSKALGL
ncbi:MAG: SDR family NAD(P)-dependent oxidoreductase [Myxococcota bacterium]